MIEFPCDFPIKIILNNQAGATDEVIYLVRRHHPELSDSAIKTSMSQNKKYVSITITITAQNQDSLDALYRELTLLPYMKMVL